MKTNDNIAIDNNHSIEWGESTWDKKEISIRNRFDNEDGKFIHSASNEISWNDFNTMIIESVKKNHFTVKELETIKNAIFLLNN